MSYLKAANLLRTIISKTSQGKLLWEETVDEKGFQAVIGSHVLQLSTRYVPDEYGPNYILSIYDSDGKLIEEVNDEQLEDFIENPFQDMRDLFETARRQALGVEQAIDDILEDLDAMN